MFIFTLCGTSKCLFEGLSGLHKTFWGTTSYYFFNPGSGWEGLRFLEKSLLNRKKPLLPAIWPRTVASEN